MFKRLFCLASLIVSICFNLSSSFVSCYDKWREDKTECFVPLSGERISNNRSPTQTVFSGNATSINIGPLNNFMFYYPREYKYFRFISPSRRVLSLNYSGPTASLRIFYSNFFTNNDCLFSTTDISTAVDCYLFDKNNEYIIEIAPYSISSPTSFSLQLTGWSLSTLSNHTKYVFHQIFDSNSNIGFHYQIEYLNVNEITSTSTNYYINSYSNNTSYINAIETNEPYTHWFYDPNTYQFSDTRRVVGNTGYDEYSSIAYGESLSTLMNKANVYVEGEFCFSGTFISPTSVVTSAHCIFNCDYYNIGPNRFIAGTGLNRSMTFNPGINDYSSEDYYGEYTVTEIYASVSYLLQFSQDGDYACDCADYDWAICLTSNTVVGTRTHSYMGISGFSYSPLSEPWPFAYNAGYPSLKSLPPDAYLYEKTLWASYPLNKNVTIHTNGRRIESNEIIISGGNSGGPIYTKEVAIQYGQVIKTVYLLGIVSGSHINDDKDEFTSYFYRNTALIVNIARLVAL